jgi:hypothetical protein
VSKNPFKIINKLMKNKFKKWLLKKSVSDFASILAKLMSNGINESYKIHDDSVMYWEEPSEIHDWLNSHGVNIKAGIVPRYIDGGAGRAYFIDNYVVKFSRNPVEANVAKMTASNKSLPTPIIDVISLKNNVYAILQHKINMDAPKKIKEAADFVTMICDDYPEMDGFPSDLETQKKLSIEVLKKYNGDMDLLPFMLIILSNLSKLYKATGFKHDDAGPTNVGVMGGNIVFPDLGPNQTKDFDHNNALDNIENNRKRLGLPNYSRI